MSGTFRVWNAVIYLSTAEPKSAMRDSDRGNRGIRNREWSGVERNRAERSRIRIIRIKIKEKCDIIAPWRCGGGEEGSEDEGRFKAEMRCAWTAGGVRSTSEVYSVSV